MKYFLLALWSLLIAVPAAYAQSNYRIQPGDSLAIEVLEDSSLNRSILVLPDGTVNFPFAGSIRASGKTAAQLQNEITAGIASNFASPPTVFVTVAQLAPVEAGAITDGINVYFVGEILTPGLQAVEPGTTFLQAVAQSGGFTPFAATKRVQLRRFDARTGRQSTFTMDFKALGRGANLTNNIVLQDGDVILVPERRLFE